MTDSLTDAFLRLVDSFLIAVTCRGNIVVVSPTVEQHLGHYMVSFDNQCTITAFWVPRLKYKCHKAQIPLVQVELSASCCSRYFLKWINLVGCGLNKCLQREPLGTHDNTQTIALVAICT